VTVYFTSDTHFGDHRTLNIYKRPFASVAEMDAHLVAEWNAVVGPEDEVWHLGDFARKLGDVPALLERLNGRKHLVRGNNDSPRIAEVPGWVSVCDYREMQLGERKLVLCHYAFRSWNGQHRGAVNLHGHSHGRMKTLLRQFDVGVDPRGFQPVTLDQLLSRRA
jgi:calcineurin-like phosphoesterase family protein